MPFGGTMPQLEANFAQVSKFDNKFPSGRIKLGGKFDECRDSARSAGTFPNRTVELVSLSKAVLNLPNAANRLLRATQQESYEICADTDLTVVLTAWNTAGRTGGTQHLFVPQNIWEFRIQIDSGFPKKTTAPSFDETRKLRTHANAGHLNICLYREDS